MLTLNRDTRMVLAAIVGVILFVGLGNAFTWFGPDPSQVIRASSATVPRVPLLSKEETVAELEKIALHQSYNADKVTLDLSKDGALNIFRKSDSNGYESTIFLPLSQLDTFVYAEHRSKGERVWSIHVFCTNYQPCINGSNNRGESDFRLNAEAIFYVESDGAVLQILGLLNRLLDLHDAQSTIDTRKNTIRISQEYWKR